MWFILRDSFSRPLYMWLVLCDWLYMPLMLCCACDLYMWLVLHIYIYIYIYMDLAVSPCLLHLFLCNVGMTDYTCVCVCDSLHHSVLYMWLIYLVHYTCDSSDLMWLHIRHITHMCESHMEWISCTMSQNETHVQWANMCRYHEYVRESHRMNHMDDEPIYICVHHEYVRESHGMKHMYNEPIYIDLTNMYESHIEWITCVMSHTCKWRVISRIHLVIALVPCPSRGTSDLRYLDVQIGQFACPLFWGTGTPVDSRESFCEFLGNPAKSCLNNTGI